jgi:hypothetical protein
MANATLSPKQLSTLLASLDEAQRIVLSMRDQLIGVMAARRRPAVKRTLTRRRLR